MRLTFISSAVIALIFTGATSVAAELRAGAGKSDIRTSPDMWPIDGFTTEHDPLAVRALVFDDGHTRAAIVVIDQTSISEGVISKTKIAMNHLAAVLEDNTIVIASHTFSAPHIFLGAPSTSPGGDGRQNNARPGSAPESLSPSSIAFAKGIDSAVETAAKLANDSLQPVTIGFGVGTSDVSVNRDLLTSRGWWLGADAAGFSDRTLPILRVDQMNGKPLAVLINEAVQSSVMDHAQNQDGKKPITADIAGAATHFVEQQYGGSTIALFLIGAAGDQAPILQGNRYVQHADGSTTREDIHEAGFALVDLLGERLGSEAMQVSESIKTAPAASIQIWRRSIEVSTQAGAKGLPSGAVKEYIYQPGPKVQVPVVLMRIGDVAIVGLQAELAASAGAGLKEHSPFPHTMVVTMVDGGAKYMPDASSYPRFTYEARNSRYAQGSAEIVVTGIELLLTEMQKSSTLK